MSTANDKAVLAAILNPLMPTAPDNDEAEISEEKSEQLTEAEAKAKELELTGVKAAENGDLKGAMKNFEKAISVCPDRASCYNNRAQCHRIMNRVDDAFEDLNRAVSLTEKNGEKGKAACQAYTQRALIWRLKGEDEKAREDFRKAASLGSAFAQTQLTAMNPYAAMCNKMLKEAIDKLNRGVPEDQAEPGPGA